jgi:hypothetical protein
MGEAIGSGWAEMEPAAYLEYLQLREWQKVGKSAAARYLPPGQ